MRIAELIETRRFRLTEGPVPEARPGEVVVRVRAVGICGSDLHYYEDGGIGEVKFPLPVVMGHEPTGEILTTGAGVTGWAPGDRAFLEPAVYCYHCEYCRSGRHNVCANIRFFSAPPDPGYFREFVNMPAENLVPLPREIDWNVGTLFEPLAVALHSLGLASFSLGETAAVFGTGPIGLLTIAVLKAAGASRVWAVEPVAERRAMAQAIGADVVLDPRQVDVVRQIQQDTGKRGVDVVFDCATKENTVALSILSVSNGGRVVITGIPSESATPMNTHELRRKEAVVYNVRRSNHETAAAVEMLRQYPKLFAPIISHVLGIEKIQDAFNMLEHKQDGASKIVLTF